MLESKTLSDWNSYVVKCRLEGHPINLTQELRNWMIHKQRCTTAEALQYAYKFCGEEYRSKEFDKFLNNILTEFMHEEQFVYIQKTDLFVVNNCNNPTLKTTYL